VKARVPNVRFIVLKNDRCPRGENTDPSFRYGRGGYLNFVGTTLTGVLFPKRFQHGTIIQRSVRLLRRRRVFAYKPDRLRFTFSFYSLFICFCLLRPYTAAEISFVPRRTILPSNYYYFEFRSPRLLWPLDTTSLTFTDIYIYEYLHLRIFTFTGIYI